MKPRGSEPWPAQLAAFVIAIAGVIASGIVNLLTHEWFGVTLVPGSAVLVVIACLITIYVRSPWPVIALAVLAAASTVYEVVINWGSSQFPGRSVMVHKEIGSYVRYAVELAVGALAGWLWYRRELRQVSVPRC